MLNPGTGWQAPAVVCAHGSVRAPNESTVTPLEEQMADRRIELEQGILALIILTYMALGILYAVVTPPWQVPDEPAHYN